MLVTQAVYFLAVWHDSAVSLPLGDAILTQPGNTNFSGRLSTIDLLSKFAQFCLKGFFKMINAK